MALFDTLRASQRLREAGFDEAKAGAIVSAFAEDIGERVATREDIHRLEERMVRFDDRMVRFDERMVQFDDRLGTTEERLEQRLVLRLGIMVVAATSVLLSAIGIATGVIVSL